MLNRVRLEPFRQLGGPYRQCAVADGASAAAVPLAAAAIAAAAVAAVAAAAAARMVCEGCPAVGCSLPLSAPSQTLNTKP